MWDIDSDIDFSVECIFKHLEFKCDDKSSYSEPWLVNFVFIFKLLMLIKNQQLS